MAALPANKNNDNWIPNLTGRVDPIAEQAIDYLFRAVYMLRSGVGISTQAITKITEAALPAITASVIPATNIALAAGGSNPLSIQNLPGISSSPQPASITVVTALPMPGDPLSTLGSTVSFQGVQYTYTVLPILGSTPFWQLSAALGTTYNGTHALRLANFDPKNSPIGVSFYETDRGATYQVQSVAGSHAWVYVSGVMNDLIANIPSDLGLNDVGFLFNATDFQHQYSWNGTVWHFASSDSGSDFYLTSGNPAGPNGGLWGKADGTTYSVAQDDSTVASVVSSVITNGWLRR